MDADSTHLVPERTCERCGLPVPAIHECCPACLLNDLKLVANEYFDPTGSFGGRLVGSDFTVLEEIGRGGMGVVFRARQHSPSREVAIKVLLPHLASSPDIRRRLFAEAAAMAELNHPGILPLYASGEHEGQPWLAMKLAPGGSLATRRGEWVNDWRKAAELLAGLADAVQHAHERGLIHRDVKPGNVLFDETGRACLADFGLVKWLDAESSDTLSQAMLGTPAYLAPEVAKLGARSATTASDIYGLGAVLYELLTGAAPFKGASTAELLQRIMAEDPPAPRRVKPEIPVDLEIICQKALSKEPGTRYASAANLGADLRRWLGGEMIRARRFSSGERIVRWARRHPLPTALTVALAAALLAGGGIVWSQNQSLKITNAQLDASVVEARKARTAAEDRVDYMTRELPSQLEPIGRLEVLNGVFEDIEKYYDGPHPSRDAVGLARQAEFRIQWAEFLRPQGKGAEARQELERAVQLGHHATQLPGGGPDVWRVYVSALRNRGGYATFEDDHELALESIQEALMAAETGLRLHPGNFSISVERADAMLGQAYSTRERRLAGDAKLTKTLLESSSNEWANLLARRVPDDRTNKRIRRQEAASQFHSGVTALDLRDLNGALVFFRKCHAMLTSIAADSPGNFEDQLFLSSTCNRIATTLMQTSHAQGKSPLQQEVEQLLAQSEQISSALVERDGFNQRWRAEWGLSAQAMANLEHKRKKYSEAS